MILQLLKKLQRGVYKLIYLLGLKRDYHDINRFDYLERIKYQKSIHDRWYFNDRDAGQFSNNEVLVRTEYSGHSIYFHCDPASVIEGEIIKKGLFDQTILDIAKDFVIPGSIILDIGANIGAYTIPLAKIFPDCAVYAFEPNPAVSLRLRNNIEVNRIKNVSIFELGLSDRAGTQNFFAIKQKTSGQYDYGLSSFVKSAVKIDSADSIQVRIDTLDDILRKPEKPIGFLKIDVQGFEYNVLAGGLELIERHKPCIIFEFESEYFASSEDAAKTKEALQKIFARLNYSVYYISLPFGPSMLAPVRWENVTNANLLAVPFNAL